MENEGIELLGRLDGPLNLRLLLQPVIAAILGYRDGSKDFTNGASPYFWTMTQASAQERSELLRHGWASIGKVFLLAFALDCLFQYLVTGTIAFVGSVLVAAVLAVLPYLFLRGAVNRWKSRAGPKNTNANSYGERQNLLPKR